MSLKRTVLLALLVPACATGTPSDSGPSTASQLPGFIETEAPDPAVLNSYGIPSGRCGMILWTPSGSKIAPVFTSVDSIEATMQIEGEEVPLSLRRQSGEIRFGMRAEQVFAAVPDNHAGTTVETKLRWGQPFPSGSYIRGGTITLTGADGWQRIMPVAGIAGCKA